MHAPHHTHIHSLSLTSYDHKEIILYAHTHACTHHTHILMHVHVRLMHACKHHTHTYTSYDHKEIIL